MKQIKTEYKTSVPFYDIDPMGVLWHGNYIKLLEEARCDMLNKIGYNYLDMKKDNVQYPVAKMELKFVRPAYFMQNLKITTVLTQIEPALEIKYKITDDKTNETILKAKTMQIAINETTKESVYKAPSEFLRKINEYK